MNHGGIVALILICLGLAGATELTQGGCSCAVFSDSLSSEPLIEHALSFNVTCDEEGSENCLQLCIALAEGAKDRAPSLICEKLDMHVENLKVSVHARACSDDNWRFTGLEVTEGICCHEGKETPCSTPPGE